MNQRSLFLRAYFIGESSCCGLVSRLVQSSVCGVYVYVRVLSFVACVPLLARVCVNVITGFSNRDVSATNQQASNDRMGRKYGKDIQIPLDIVQSI